MTEVLDPGDCPVSRPVQWWALSPLDLHGHLLLPEGCHPQGVLQARCGHLLPMMAMRFAAAADGSLMVIIRCCRHRRW